MHACPGDSSGEVLNILIELYWTINLQYSLYNETGDLSFNNQYYFSSYGLQYPTISSSDDIYSSISDQ
jgi:hypothetical protein